MESIKIIILQLLYIEKKKTLEPKDTRVRSRLMYHEYIRVSAESIKCQYVYFIVLQCAGECKAFNYNSFATSQDHFANGGTMMSCTGAK